MKTTRKTPSAGALLAAACDIVAGGGGLHALALRPLAQKLGVSVTVLATHFGDRAGVLAAICRAASASDAVPFERWRATLAAMGAMTPAMAADLAEAMLEEEATARRALSMLYVAMLHASASDPSLRPAFAGWAGQRRGFWDEFGRRAGIPGPMLACGWWHGYAIAEQFYGLALDGNLPYRMLRRLCLQRLFAGPAAGSAAAAEDALFVHAGERMRHAMEPPAAGADSARVPAWLAPAARACGMRLAAEGIGGLTHRAVAADIGIAHTTLSYRFPTQHHLVLAGLASITAHVLGAVDGPGLDDVQRLRSEGDGRKLDLARANCAVALAATHMPELVPHTAHMRSRRGIHLARVFRKYLPDTPGIDALCAQVVSLGLTGLINSLPPGDACEQSVQAAFTAAARWLQDRHR
ncbi:hypothetical protein [Pseudoduganella lutea]|uniref:TetR family transcriptional regulator n=1 Tax=Pseudoduganella lutea TaxID=321985 RepID=A0A4P6KRP4_9BURK|nr:hypothetical protein [Pseudoduganella lutea]QBE61749.1 hypothetical protein EWM63_00995 [Pseudoduganella lutea]